MKQNHYIVTFNNGKTVFASGFNTEEVEILAKAVMIKSGLSYDIKSVKTTSNLSDMVDTDFVAQETEIYCSFNRTGDMI